MMLRRALASLLLFAAGCSSDADPSPKEAGGSSNGGEPSANGGSSWNGSGNSWGSGGTSDGTGGVPWGSGGTSSGTGGDFQGTGGIVPATGGVTSSTGGTIAAGGVATTGGTTGQGETGRLVGLTAAINAVRAGIATTPPLPPMTWSSSIALVAQAYAEKEASTGCLPLTHSGNKTYGENIAWYQGFVPTAADPVNDWAGESACYTFGTVAGTAQCSCTNSGCGHYTQLVWRNTTQVGCGFASCVDGGEIWVCNFAPPGNIIGQTPY